MGNFSGPRTKFGTKSFDGEIFSKGYGWLISPLHQSLLVFFNLFSRKCINRGEEFNPIHITHICSYANNRLKEYNEYDHLYVYQPFWHFLPFFPFSGTFRSITSSKPIYKKP